MRSLQLLVTLFGFLLVAVLSAQNPFQLSIAFLWLESVKLPLGFIAVIAVGAGICTACLGLTALTDRSHR